MAAMLRARADALAFFQAQCPGQVAAVNGLGVLATDLPSDFTTYAGGWRRAQPPTPALYVIPALSGFRGTQWAAAIDQQHGFDVVVQIGHQDDETAMEWMLGYSLVVMNAIEQWILGRAPLAHAQQILFGAPVGDAEDVIQYQVRVPQNVGQPYYAEAIIPVTVFQTETP